MTNREDEYDYLFKGESLFISRFRSTPPSLHLRASFDAELPQVLTCMPNNKVQDDVRQTWTQRHLLPALDNLDCCCRLSPRLQYNPIVVQPDDCSIGRWLTRTLMWLVKQHLLWSHHAGR